MIIIGHPHIPSESFIHIASLSELENTLKNNAQNNISSKVFFFSADEDKEFDLARFCTNHNINFAVIISSVKECVLYAQYSPKYLILRTSFEIIKSCQHIADSYLFDSKILAIINDENEVESIALAGIDGAIFLSAL